MSDIEHCSCLSGNWPDPKDHNVNCAYVRIAELEAELVNYKRAHTVHELSSDRDQTAFVFTSRLQGLVSEFSGVLSTAAAIGAFEVVKHELIADALEVSDE